MSANVKIKLIKLTAIALILFAVVPSALPLKGQPSSLPSPMYGAKGEVDESGWVYHFDLDLSTPGDQQVITVDPGQTVTGYIEYQMWSGAGNPYEIGQLILLYSWAGVPPSYYTCIEDRIVGVYPGISGSKKFSFVAPSTPGTYYIWPHKGAHYSCEQQAETIVALPPNENAIGVVIVKSGPAFELKIRIDKGCGTTYYPGEELKLYVEVNKPAYIIITEELPDGSIKKIGEGEVDAGTTVIPGVVSGKYGEGWRKIIVEAFSYPEEEYARAECSFYVESINEPPVASLEAQPTIVYVGETVNFDASSSYDPDGRVVSYFFDFGDGHSSGWISQSSVSHSYQEPGTWYARVKVRDDDGAESEWSSPVKIEVKANVGILHVHVVDEKGMTIKTARIYLDWVEKGDTKDGRMTLYVTPGYHVVRAVRYPLEGEEEFEIEAGEVKEITIVLKVREVNQPPTAYIDSISPNPAVKGQTISFSGHGYDPDGSITSYEWRSSIDGILSKSDSFSTSSLSEGVHTIFFKVMDDKGQWSEEVTATLIVKSSKGIQVEGNAASFLARYYEEKSKLFQGIADNLEKYTDLESMIEEFNEDLRDLAEKYKEEILPSTPSGIARKIAYDLIKDMFGASTLDNEGKIMISVLEAFRLAKRSEIIAWLAIEDVQGKLGPLISDLRALSNTYDEISEILSKYVGSDGIMEESDARKLSDLLQKAKRLISSIKTYPETIKGLEDLIESGKITINPIHRELSVERGKEVEVWSGDLNTDTLLDAGGYIRIIIEHLSPEFSLFGSKPRYKVVVYNENSPEYKRLSDDIAWHFWDGKVKEKKWGAVDIWAHLETVPMGKIHIVIIPEKLGGGRFPWSKGEDKGRIRVTIEFLEGGVGYIEDEYAVRALETLRTMLYEEMGICTNVDDTFLSGLSP